MIRRATFEDIPDLVIFAAHFAHKIGHEINAEHTAHYLAWAISEGVVFRGEKGAIGGMMQNTPFDREIKIATELFWWSEGGEGLRLLRAYERWAKEMGSTYVCVSTLAELGENAPKILKRYGYDLREAKYAKEL